MSQTSAPLQLFLLGGFKLLVNGREVTNLPRKARALLAYLALQDGKPVSREAMADLLWTDRGAEQARHSLRQTLLVLKRELDGEADQAVLSHDGGLSLSLDTAEVDTHQYRRLSSSASQTDLALAAQHYAGTLLDGFPPIAPEFDDWLARMRAEMADAAVAMMGRLADFHMVAGETEDAIRICERMVSMDPLREDVHRRLMAAYAKAGRRADAIRHYHTCAEILQQQLSVSPAPETEALFVDIRDGLHEGGARVTPQQRPFIPSGLIAQHAEGVPWIAVLPFRAMGPDPVPGYFVAGVVEDIVCTLATLREPIVVSANTTLTYRDQPIDIRHIGRQLGVRYVVAGSIRRRGSALRLVVELAEAETGAVRWAQTYETTDHVLFDAQDDAVTRIVNSLVPRLSEIELQRVRRKHADNLTAYDLVLQAKDLMFRLTRDASDQAGALLQRATNLDPNYSTAFATLATWQSLRFGQGWTANTKHAAGQLSSAARTAIELDSYNAQALALLGHSRTIMSRDYEEARQLFDQALQAAPNDATVWTLSSPTAAYVGDAKESIRRAETALRLSPRDQFAFRIHCFLSLAHYTNGSFEEAAHWGQLSVAENPRYTGGLRAAAAALAAIGRLAEAREIASHVAELEPSYRVDTARMLWQNPETRERYADDLSTAGLNRE